MESKKIVREYMDRQIAELEDGLNNLNDRDDQPSHSGNLYNGMLKHAVTFEIEHMRNLRDELLQIL